MISHRTPLGCFGRQAELRAKQARQTIREPQEACPIFAVRRKTAPDHGTGFWPSGGGRLAIIEGLMPSSSECASGVMGRCRLATC
jgi:hypothetical protein